MSTAIDTNVFIALWDTNPQISAVAQKALDTALERGALVVCGAVYVELMARPERTEDMLDRFFGATCIQVDWGSGEQVWREAGRAFQCYVDRRSREKQEIPRRILADFFIGAHASLNNHRFLTFDKRLYSAAFPELEVVTF